MCVKERLGCNFQLIAATHAREPYNGIDKTFTLLLDTLKAQQATNRDKNTFVTHCYSPHEIVTEQVWSTEQYNKEQEVFTMELK